jgi:hypothetical protein
VRLINDIHISKLKFDEKGRYMANCSHSSAPGDEELVRFAVEEDSLPLEKREHLEQCPICQQRLAEYTRLNDALVERFYRGFCPGGIKLSLYCEDLLAAEERTNSANHVLQCPFCTAEVAYTRRFMQDAPPVVETGFSPRSTIRRLIGVLTRQQAHLVTRQSEENIAPENAPPKNAWPRQYRADGIDLSLHLSRATSGERILLGILSSVDSTASVDVFEGTAVELHPGTFLSNIGQQTLQDFVQQVQVDELGNFAFHAVPNGDYILLIHLPDKDVVIEQIHIEQLS